MGPSMKGNSRITIFTERGNIPGLMGEATMVVGSTINEKGMVFIDGPMGKLIQETLRMIKRMVLEFWNSLMVESMKENGSTINNMVKDSFL